MKPIILAAIAVAFTVTACSGTRYEPCPFAGIDGVDGRGDCKSTEVVPNVKKNAKPVKNISINTPRGTYNTCPFAGIDSVQQRDCKAIGNVNNIAKGEKVGAMKTDNTKVKPAKKSAK